MLLFETLSPNQRGGSQNSQPYQGRYLLFGEHITMLFHWRKIQHKNRILLNIEKYMLKCDYSYGILLS